MTTAAPLPSVADAIRATLLTPEPKAKAFAARDVARRWRLGKLAWRFDTAMPDRPAWPDSPQLLPPSQMPRRGKAGSERGRIALWHALAHIEFVAIDLPLDIVGRFGGAMPRDFTDDFLSVAADEAMHFALLDRKLRLLGSHYGALPAHSGLWQAAEETSNDVMARLAVVPMVLEARGLDVTPATRDRIAAQGDPNGVRILQRILDDEIRHVGFGTKHFVRCAQALGVPAQNRWRDLVRLHFRGAIKPPFNDSARFAAGLSRDFYDALAS